MNILPIKKCISSTFNVKEIKYLNNGKSIPVEDFDISLSEKNLAKNICDTVYQLIKNTYFEQIPIWSCFENQIRFSYDDFEIIFTAEDKSFNFESIRHSMNIEFENIKYCQADGMPLTARRQARFSTVINKIISELLNK